MQRTWLVTALIACLALGVLVPVIALTRPVAGASGIGDDYFPLQGNGGYDVAHYDIGLRYDPDRGSISGTTTITARITQRVLASLNLDLTGLDVQEVTLNDEAVAWSRDGQEMTVHFGERHPRRGDVMTIAVRYGGVPTAVSTPVLADAATGWTRTSDGALVVSQPNGASTWFPSNDHPSDKATFAVTLTTPPATVAVANGLPGPTSAQSDGWSATTWYSDQPMATYLATVAAGDYVVRRSQLPNGLPVIDALGNTSSNPVARDVEELDRLGEELAFLEDILGPYPFTSTGSIVSSDNLGFALENQTRSVYGREALDGRNNPNAAPIIVHEQAHQWLGDLVTIATWKDIWLNEGPATYMEWLWGEREGWPTAEQRFAELACRSAADADAWGIRPGDPGPENLFSTPVYDRGAMTLHALRQAIGEDDFFAVLRAWTTSGGDQTRTTADFVRLAEATSGQQLDHLFRTWLYTRGKPATLDCTRPPSTPPTVPNDVTTNLDAAQHSATISWTAPTSAGGSPITSYRVSRTALGAADDDTWSIGVSKSARSWTFEDLLDGETYALSVQAVTRAGTSPPVTGTVTLTS